MSNDDEAILDAVLSGRQAKAILLAYRRDAGTLESAWYVVNGLGDDQRFEEPDQDPSYTRVEHYLRGTEPWREKTKWLAIAAAFLIVGMSVIVWKLPAFLMGIDSYGWSVQMATIVNVEYRDVQKLRQQREETWHMRKYQYQYESDSGPHRKSVGFKRFFPSLGDERFHKGDAIEILVDPDDPERSLHQREMYGRCFPITIGLIVMLPGIVMSAFFAFDEWSYRDLRRSDPAVSGVVG